LPPLEPELLELLELEDELELLEDELELLELELEFPDEELLELDELLEDDEFPLPGSTPQTRPLLSYTGIFGASAP